jgi:VanZ family protein
LKSARLFCIAFGWAMVLAVVWVSLTPSPPEVDFVDSDKYGHFLAYGALMFWFGQLYRRFWERVAYACGFTALGLALEALQGLLGYRTYDVFDLVANTLGVLMGWAASLILPTFLPAGKTGTL